MALRLSERWQAVIFAVVLVAAIGGLYATTQLLQPAAVPSQVIGFPKLDVQGNGWSIHYAPIVTTNNTAFGLLLEASANLSFSVTWVTYQIPQGVFVTAINGSVNGEGGNWLYSVNGVYANVAADHLALHDNDRVLWTFSLSPGGW